jgi:DNA replication protein DnaC
MALGRSVYFTPLSDLVRALAKAEREGTLREKIRFFCRFSLLIVDEIGYLPVIPAAVPALPKTDLRRTAA